MSRRTIGSLSGATLVRTKEAGGPISLSEVTTGQHVACLGDLADLSLTPTTRWCEVKAFVRNKLRGRPRHTVHFLHLVVSALRDPKASACAAWPQHLSQWQCLLLTTAHEQCVLRQCPCCRVLCHSLVQVNANERDLQQFEVRVSKPGAGSVKLVANGHLMVPVLAQTSVRVKDTNPPALTAGTWVCCAKDLLIGRANTARIEGLGRHALHSLAHACWTVFESLVVPEVPAIAACTVRLQRAPTGLSEWSTSGAATGCC